MNTPSAPAMPPLTPSAPPVAPHLVTVEEFLANYANVRAELVEGVVKELPTPGLKHCDICSLVNALFFNHVRANNLGRVMGNDSWVRTGPGTVRGGDVLFYSYERLPRETVVLESIHTIPPDVVVEVKSPTGHWGEILMKVGEYLKAGVRVVVVLDPATTTVSIYSDEGQQILNADAELTLPEVLPGFAAPVASLFA